MLVVSCFEFGSFYVSVLFPSVDLCDGGLVDDCFGGAFAS